MVRFFFKRENADEDEMEQWGLGADVLHVDDPDRRLLWLAGATAKLLGQGASLEVAGSPEPQDASTAEFFADSFGDFEFGSDNFNFRGKTMPEDNDQPTAGAPLRYKARFRLGGPSRIGGALFERLEESDRTEHGFEESKDVTVPTCKSCNSAIHEPKDLGGSCWICREVVCTGCSQVRCHFHRKIVCESCAVRVRGNIGCAGDSILEMMWLAFLPEQR